MNQAEELAWPMTSHGKEYATLPGPSTTSPPNWTPTSLVKEQSSANVSLAVLVNNHSFCSHDISPTPSAIKAKQSSSREHAIPNVVTRIKQLMQTSDLCNKQCTSLLLLNYVGSLRSSLASRALHCIVEIFDVKNITTKRRSLQVTPESWCRCSRISFMTQKGIEISFGHRKWIHDVTLQIVAQPH